MDIVVSLVCILIALCVIAAVLSFLYALRYFIIVAVIIAGVAWFFGLFDNLPSLPSFETSKPKPQIVRTVKHRSPEQRAFHEKVSKSISKKSNVNLSTLRPELDTAIVKITQAYRKFMTDDNFVIVITSGDDSDKHNTRSAHYDGAAVDVRIKDIGDVYERKALANQVKEKLGRRFYVLHEDIGSNNEHLHVQLFKQYYNAGEEWRN